MRARETVVSIGVALIGFALTALAIHPWIRDPQHLYSSMRGEKLALLHAGHGSIFSAAFGSSHIHNGFSPRAFDSAMAASPLPSMVHTENLAIAGGSQTEQRMLALDFVRQLAPPALSHAPPQACLVLLELDAGVNFQIANLLDARVIDLYDWKTVQFARLFSPPTMSPVRRMSRSLFADLALLLHWSNIGMVSAMLVPPSIDGTSYAAETGEDRRGQSVLPLERAHLPERVALVRNAPARPALQTGQIVPGNYTLVDELAKAAGVRGVSFVYFLYPKLSDLTQAVDYPDHLEAAGQSVPIINLARPDQYPQLYQPELWHDQAHLNLRGAELASTLLGRALSRWYTMHGLPRACGG